MCWSSRTLENNIFHFPIFFFVPCRSALPRAEDFYSCQEDAITIVHDTAIQLKIKYNPLEVLPDANFDKNILDVRVIMSCFCSFKI